MNPQEKMGELIQAGKPLARLYAELEEWEDIKETAQTVISQAESAQERIKVQIGQEIGKLRAVKIEDGTTSTNTTKLYVQCDLCHEVCTLSHTCTGIGGTK